MNCRENVYMFVASVCFITTAHTQILNGDSNFPVLNEMRWEMNHDDVRKLCEARHVLASSTDSMIVAEMLFFGLSARTEIAFFAGSEGVHDIRVKFHRPTRETEDTLVKHFTALTGKPPVRQTKQKSILVVTLKMETAGWKLSNGTVFLITAKRNEEIFDLLLSFLPPVKEKG